MVMPFCCNEDGRKKIVVVAPAPMTRTRARMQKMRRIRFELLLLCCILSTDLDSWNIHIFQIFSLRNSYPCRWSDCCSLHVVIIVLVVRVLICDIVNIPFLSVGVVVGVYIFLDNLFAAQPVETSCYFDPLWEEVLTWLVVWAQLTVPTRPLSNSVTLSTHSQR